MKRGLGAACERAAMRLERRFDLLSFRTRPEGAEPGLQPRGSGMMEWPEGDSTQSPSEPPTGGDPRGARITVPAWPSPSEGHGGPGIRTPKRSRAAVFKFSRLFCVWLRVVASVCGSMCPRMCPGLPLTGAIAQFPGFASTSSKRSCTDARPHDLRGGQIGSSSNIA